MNALKVNFGIQLFNEFAAILSDLDIHSINVTTKMNILSSVKYSDQNMTGPVIPSIENSVV